MLQIGDKMPAFAAYDETRKEVTDKDMLKKDQVKQYSEAKFIQAVRETPNSLLMGERKNR